MAMRDLVTGGAACAGPGSPSSSNPLGALAGKIFGSSGKAEELRGLPGATVAVPAPSDFGVEAPLSTIPGSEYDNQQYQQPDARSSAFVDGFRTAVHENLADAWDEVHRPPILSHALGRESESHFAEFDQIYDTRAGSHLQPTFDESIRYYVRALAMNPKADNAWNYLRISLSCASQIDMFEACDS